MHSRPFVEYRTLGEQLQPGLTFPRQDYTDPAYFELEQKHIFNRSWIYAGRTHQVSRIGDFLTCQVGEFAVLIVLEDSNTLKAYVDVHKPIALETFGPFIFVNPTHSDPSWKEALGSLPHLMSETGFDLNQLKFREERAYEIKANWKIILENFLESYQTDGVSHSLWPSFMINTYPGQGNASTQILIPVDANRTIVVYEYFLDDHMTQEEARKVINFIDEIHQEDMMTCESSQRRLKAPSN